MNKQTQPH